MDRAPGERRSDGLSDDPACLGAPGRVHRLHGDREGGRSGRGERVGEYALRRDRRAGGQDDLVAGRRNAERGHLRRIDAVAIVEEPGRRRAREHGRGVREVELAALDVPVVGDLRGVQHLVVNAHSRDGQRAAQNGVHGADGVPLRGEQDRRVGVGVDHARSEVFGVPKFAVGVDAGLRAVVGVDEVVPHAGLRRHAFVGPTDVRTRIVAPVADGAEVLVVAVVEAHIGAAGTAAVAPRQDRFLFRDGGIEHPGLDRPGGIDADEPRGRRDLALVRIAHGTGRVKRDGLHARHLLLEGAADPDEVGVFAQRALVDPLVIAGGVVPRVELDEDLAGLGQDARGRKLPDLDGPGGLGETHGVGDSDANGEACRRGCRDRVGIEPVRGDRRSGRLDHGKQERGLARDDQLVAVGDGGVSGIGDIAGGDVAEARHAEVVFFGVVIVSHLGRGEDAVVNAHPG